jgi:hypothetical protein
MTDGRRPTKAGEWIAAHAEQPPLVLRERLDVILHSDAAAAGASIPDALLDSGVHLLSEILRHGSAQRDAALDLLTADALVTYAFEAAADDPASLDARAAAAMRQISLVVDGR